MVAQLFNSVSLSCSVGMDVDAEVDSGSEGQSLICYLGHRNVMSAKSNTSQNNVKMAEPQLSSNLKDCLFNVF